MADIFVTDPAPSAGRRRVFIASLGIGQIVSWGTLYYSFPLMVLPMESELGASRPEIYAAATVGLLASSLAAYPVGAAIDRGRGRAIMTIGSLAAGLLLMAWSRVADLGSLYLIFFGIGLVQAMTLYDAVFAVVARRYGIRARDGITQITLWGGFASTVFVPLIQFLLDWLGWRDTLVVIGFINLGFCVLINFLAIDPRADPRRAPDFATDKPALSGLAAVRWALGRPVFWGLMISFTAYYGTFLGLSFHLYPMLLERGFSHSAVVFAIAIIGPAQVVGRLVTWIFARHRSMRFIGAVTVIAFPVAFSLLLVAPSSFVALAAFAALFGMANGIMTIVRGIAAHEMLTRDAFGAINGALAVPSMLAEAAAPLAAAALWSAAGSYDALVLACLMGALILAAGFWFAAWAAR